MNKARSIAQALGGRVLRVVEENENSTVGGTGAFAAYDSISLAREEEGADAYRGGAVEHQVKCSINRRD